MNVIKYEINILNGSADNCFIAVQKASNQSGYCGQYLRKMLRYEKIRGIKIGQLWLIECKSLLEYVEEVTITEDLRYGPRIKNKVSEKPNKQEQVGGRSEVNFGSLFSIQYYCEGKSKKVDADPLIGYFILA